MRDKITEFCRNKNEILKKVKCKSGKVQILNPDGITKKERTMKLSDDLIYHKELVEKAKVNTEDDFKFAFNKAFMNIVVNRMEHNQAFFTKILDDEEFKNVLMGYLLPETYEKLKNTAEI